MLADHLYSLFDSRWIEMFACLNKILDLVKDPRISDRRATDHDPIHIVTVFIFKSFFRGIDVTVPKDGNVNTWVVFHFADQCPVSFTFVKLCPGSSVNSQGFNSYIL